MNPEIEKLLKELSEFRSIALERQDQTKDFMEVELSKGMVKAFDLSIALVYACLKLPPRKSKL